MKKTVLFITPHLSTGGLPQYLYKQIELIHNDVTVYCIEWEDITGGRLVVQRNKIKELLGNRLVTLQGNKHELFNYINNINPHVIHLQEIPELFMQNDITQVLYNADRPYVLIETTHTSQYDVRTKRYLPDKFLLVSKYQFDAYAPLGVPCDVVQYPIEYKVRNQSKLSVLNKLGWNSEYKHVINVGLFTPGKNQAEVIEYARRLSEYPIQFHFIGNQAENFREYWEPLMQQFPSNCKWWNERDDVDMFYQAADMMLFTSTLEAMPLVVKESICWKLPTLLYNLPTYTEYFSRFDNISYLTENKEQNLTKILATLGLSV